VGIAFITPELEEPSISSSWVSKRMVSHALCLGSARAV